MSKRGANVSRRKFVAGAGALALGAGLAACSSPAQDKPKQDDAPAVDENKEVQAQAEVAPEKVAYDPNAGEWVRTCCNMCFNNCSIKAHVVDGVVVELTGDPDSPIGNGHICGKGASGIMQLYDPNRISKPMKRTNPEKGIGIDPGWEEITWDEALDLMDEKLSAAVAEYPRSCRLLHDGFQHDGHRMQRHRLRGPLRHVRPRKTPLPTSAAQAFIS